MTSSVISAAIADAIESDFRLAAVEDRAERWAPPDNLALAERLGEIRTFDELDAFLADIALRDTRWQVREAAILALRDRDGPGLTLLTERLNDSWKAVELQFAILRAYNAQR